MRHRWPTECVPSAELQDLVGKIFKDCTERISMEGIIKHPWLTSDGKLPSIHVSTPLREINEKLLKRCIDLGLPPTELEKALRKGERNGLTATYHMLEAQEEDKQRRRQSPILPPPLAVAPLTPSPGKFVPTKRRSSGDRAQCIIA